MRKKNKISNDDSYQSYFKEISNFSPLSKEEELLLWEDYRNNNNLSARDKLIKSNLKFVANVAKSYQGLGLSYSDLISEGNIGLLKSFEKFDVSKQLKTISYSIWWIKQSILEALNKRNLIKGDELPKDFEKDSDDNQYVDENYSSEYTDNSTLLHLKELEKKDVLENIIDCLNKREQFVISYFFGLNNNEECTLEEIGKKIGLTKERVRQIKEKALKKLRSEALKSSLNCEYNDIYK